MSALDRLIVRAHAADIAVHSLEVSVAGETVVSARVEPFGPDVPHRMYSVSKSITAIAVLLLAEEGSLRLDDPIMRHFPEMAPVHPWLEATRIEDMLAMTGPHSRTTYDAAGGGWLESYFRVPPTHRPGTLFIYDTSASYVLSALVERLTGGTLVEYLRPRLLEPLGAGDGIRFLTGPEGISHGGSGLIAAPNDLLRIAEAVNGTRPVLPASVRELLIQRRSDPATQTWGAALRAGYGRQIWLPAEGSWLMFGLGGQLVSGDPAREIAAVITGDATALASGDQRLLDLAVEALGGLGDETTAIADLRPPAPPHDAAGALSIRGEHRLLTGEDAPERIRVDADAEGGELRWDGTAIRFATGRPSVARLPIGDAVITAGWVAPGVLDVRVSAAADDIATVRLRLVATEDGVVTMMSQGFGPEIGAGWTWRGSYRR